MSVILVTNDDGVSSPGIAVLAKVLQPAGKVYIVAPEGEQSAVGHALTLHRPLKFDKINNNTFSINGTPTDCVIIGVNRLLPEKPDLIVSGINIGGNMGDDITYSGTVAAAIEGTLLNIPSIAISYTGEIRGQRSVRLQNAAKFARKLARLVLKKGLPRDTFLNVNVPDCPKIKGIELTRQGKRVYDNSIKEMSDPRGRKHYWIGGGVPLWESGEDTDFKAIRSCYISITPVHLDLTNYNALKYMKGKWKM
jgi:5'-nucleotidase